ncbi:acyl-CoA N-acyltransferase [Aspergillus californicus]
MASTTYTIRPMEKSDILETGEMLYKSKLALTINRLLFKNWPDTEAQRNNYTGTLENLDFSIMEPLSVVDNASEITYILVKPEHRGRGIGKALMEYALTKAKSLDLPVVFVTEPQVYDFFVKQGFQVTHRVDLDLADWAPPHSGFGVFRLAAMVRYLD